MPDTALPAALAAPLIALPAELVTLERPCWALLAYSDAPSFALLAVEDAASAAWEVEDWARRWTAHLLCLSARRGKIRADIVSKGAGERCELNGKWSVSFKFPGGERRALAGTGWREEPPDPEYSALRVATEVKIRIQAGLALRIFARRYGSIQAPVTLHQIARVKYEAAEYNTIQWAECVPSIIRGKLF